MNLNLSTCVHFVLFLVLVTLGDSEAEPAFCNRGFTIAGKYKSCWDKATYGNEYNGLDKAHILTPAMLEEYATHMCRVVKPIAMACLGKEMEACKEREKILHIADESGGACLHSDLNPFFKLDVIEQLTPIKTTSPCFAIGDSSYQCYANAGKEVLKGNDSLVKISQFHKVAEKFFNYIWDCHIAIFKQKEDICPHWQIPMLLALQKTAMPSLFGMHLTLHQVDKLELTPRGHELQESKEESGEEKESTNPPRPPLSATPAPPEPGCDQETDTYMLLRVVKHKSEAKPGDILVKLSAKEDERHLDMVSAPGFDANTYRLVEEVVNRKGQIDMTKLRKKIREDRIRQKEMSVYLSSIRESERRRLKEIEDKKKAMERIRQRQSRRE